MTRRYICTTTITTTYDDTRKSSLTESCPSRVQRQGGASIHAGHGSGKRSVSEHSGPVHAWQQHSSWSPGLRGEPGEETGQPVASECTKPICGMGATVTKTTVTRFVVTHVDNNGQRTLALPRSGTNTHSTSEEAQAALNEILTNNSQDRLSALFGMTLEVRPVECYPNNFDPVTRWFRKFNDGDKVVVLHQKWNMIVISAELALKGWRYRYRLAFMTKRGLPDKRMGHRFFFEDQLEKI